MEVDYKQSNEDRLRRAKSWYQQGSKEDISDEESFLFLWIAFNAAYGRIYDWGETNERDNIRNFIGRVIKLDKNNAIQRALLHNLDTWRELLENKYIYDPFWNVRRKHGGNRWRVGWCKKNEVALKAWDKGDTVGTLNEVLSRLYTLRNQMLHGGITFKDSFGKRQLRDSRPIMRELIRLIIDIIDTDIKANPDTKRWGKVDYLRFNDEPE